MPEFNLAPNSYGRVAGGQEGSGQAQIFQPYDASKFAKLEIAQKEKDKEEKAKGMKDARAFKPEDFEKIDKGWIDDAAFYADKEHVLETDMTSNTLKYYNNLATISDPDALYAANLEVAKERADINNRIRNLNQELDLGLQNKDAFDKARSVYDTADKSSFDEKETANRLRTFQTLDGQEDLLARNNGNVQETRRDLLRQWDNSLVASRFKWDDWQKERRGVYEGYGKEVTTGGSGINQEEGTLYYSEKYNKTYNLDEITNSEAESLLNNSQYKEWIKDNDVLADSLMNAYPNKNLDDITQQEVYKWAKENPDFKTYVEANFLPPNITKQTTRKTQTRESGAGAKELSDAEIQSKTESTVISGDPEVVAEWKRKNPFMAQYFGRAGEQNTGSQEGLWGGHMLTNGDVYNAVDATGVTGINTQYENPINGAKEVVDGNYTITSPGVAGIRKQLKNDIIVNGKEYKKGQYVSDDVVAGLKVGKDYKVISGTISEGYGNVWIKVGDENKKDKKSLIIKKDAIEDTNLKPETKQKAYKNEKRANELEYKDSKVIVNGQQYNAIDLINDYAAQIAAENGETEISYESYRKGKDEFESALESGEIKY